MISQMEILLIYRELIKYVQEKVVVLYNEQETNSGLGYEQH